MISNVYEAHPVCHKCVKQLNALSHLNLTAVQWDDGDDGDDDNSLHPYYMTGTMVDDLHKLSWTLPTGTQVDTLTPFCE